MNGSEDGLHDLFGLWGEADEERRREVVPEVFLFDLEGFGSDHGLEEGSEFEAIFDDGVYSGGGFIDEEMVGGVEVGGVGDIDSLETDEGRDHQTIILMGGKHYWQTY